MSAGRASGALSRTRTPLEPEPEPEPEPNHRYRVGQVCPWEGRKLRTSWKRGALGVGEAGPGSWKRACAAAV